MSQKTIAYIRVSTLKQLDGAGPEQQQASISAWALARGVLIDEFARDAESGDEEDREEIFRLKQMAEAGTLGTIVVDRLDRFARDLLVHEKLYKFFRERGVKVVCVSQEFDDSPSGVAMRQMLAVFSQLDKANRIAHLRQCKKAKVASRGTSSGGTPPYGFELAGNGKLQLVPGETKLVVRTFELRDRGLGFTEIARLLAEEGFRTRKGTVIAPTQVLRMIDREAVYRSQAPVNHVKLNDGVVPAQPAVLK